MPWVRIVFATSAKESLVLAVFTSECMISPTSIDPPGPLEEQAYYGAPAHTVGDMMP
jgi:hypothetical protein